MSGVNRHLLGIGMYGFPEAARLIGVRTGRVRAWFRGWPGGQGPVFKSCLGGEWSSRPLIGFLNLIESLVAAHLRENGVSLNTIRKAHKSLAHLLEHQFPFAHRGLFTDGKTVFVQVANEEGDVQVIEALEKQHVFERIILPYLKQIEFSAASQQALLWRVFEGVVIDPRRRFGKPIVDRCGMATSILWATYQANQRDAAGVADWFGIDPDDVEAAVEFETCFRRRVA